MEENHKKEARLIRDQEVFNDTEYNIVEVTDPEYGETPHELIMIPDPEDKDEYKEELKESGYDLDWVEEEN